MSQATSIQRDKLLAHFKAGKYTLAWRLFKSLPCDVQMQIDINTRDFLVGHAFNTGLV